MQVIARILGTLDFVNSDLIHPWPYFGSEEFALAVFPQLRGDATVIVDDTRLFSHLHLLANVPFLRIRGDDAPSLLSMTGPPALRSLFISRRARGSLEGIAAFGSISELTVETIHTVPSLAPLRELSSLEVLTLIIRRPISAKVDLEPLRAMPVLRHVNVVTDGNVPVNMDDDLDIDVTRLPLERAPDMYRPPKPPRSSSSS